MFVCMCVCLYYNIIPTSIVLSNLKHLIVFGKEDGVRSFDDLLTDGGSSFVLGDTTERNNSFYVHKESCVIPYSSGTTGRT